MLRSARLSSVLLLALAGCATAPGVATRGVICAQPGLAIDTAFPGAGIHDCVIAPDGSIVVSVDHEPTLVEGINPSPWYALRFTSDAPRDLRLTLDYTDYTHRYAPLVSADAKTWAPAPGAPMLNERKTRASFAVSIPAGVSYVAGQPMVTSVEGVAWTRAALAGKGFAEVEYGKSREGRPLVAFVGGSSAPNAKLVVMLTRQHPPETTGQDAFRAFVERITTRDDEDARRFRSTHRIVLAPMPNPDGVDDGHWRLNAGGMDLNRDWGKFTQAETRALSQLILKEAAGRSVVAMMDFHSTNRSVIYSPPLDAASPTIAFLPFLKTQLDAAVSPAPEWSYNHNAEGGTSKGWALEALKAPGVTVELSDDIPLADAQKIGATAADALVGYFTP